MTTRELVTTPMPASWVGDGDEGQVGPGEAQVVVDALGQLGPHHGASSPSPGACSSASAAACEIDRSTCSTAIEPSCSSHLTSCR
ncbi:hypothetical protein [Nonomuraea dietziae]|uniref:hypothetical protein n=1 Tax=Nonomuraea dietziae TaxID=65515 RepID=UPI0031DB172B